MMHKGVQIKRAALLLALDSEETLKGYFAGFGGETCPDGATYSFRHGWRNGMCDRGVRPIDDAQRELARDVIATGYLKGLT